MKKALKPQNENMRLRALLDYKILDTPPEISFDDITALASYICSTPIAIISLVDSERQWFKSAQGLKFSETSRDVSFCAHAINELETFQVKDATVDLRFADNPFVTSENGLRFYTGAQLFTTDGLVIGTLCVLDSQSRELKKSQLRALEALARQVMQLLEMRKLSEQNFRNFQDLKDSSQLVLEQQQKLIQTAKMSSLGTMVSGIAHEINSPLAAIISKADQILLKEKSGHLETERMKDDVSKIISTARRIEQIVRGLRTFSRDATRDKPSEASVHSIVEDVSNLCLEKLKSCGIELKIRNSLESALMCRPSEIAHALLNLVNNSADAIEKLPQKWIQIETLMTNAGLQLVVTDSGHGISPEIAKHLMKAFFTTKELGKGTGLGLSISESLIAGHGGKIFYDINCPNTRFVIELPLKICIAESFTA
jgi:two-component system NtrC family sensor kinase